jgi:hypothetical protein
MSNKKRVIYTIMFFIFAMFLVSFVSAGPLDFFKKITGKGISPQPQNVSITVRGPNPVSIEFIETISPQAPIENSTTNIVFEVHVTDPDGVNDIDDSSVNAEFSKISETTRTGACAWQNDIDSDTANYSCSIVMQYYDGAGTWNIKVQARDFGNGTLIEDTSQTFVFQELKAMIISPPSLTWPDVIPGATNQMSNNDPAIITNTGNYNGEVSVTAYDLVGETIPSELITAEDFTIGTSTGAGEPECDAPTTATAMQNTISVPIAGSNSNPGGTEEIYYCMPLVPAVSSQIYSTTGGDSWTIFY